MSRCATTRCVLHREIPKAYALMRIQPGIGTYIGRGGANPIMAKIDKVLDEMIAWNLAAHVQGGYEFLMQNCQSTSPAG